MAFSSSTISVGSTTKKSHFDQLLANTIDLKRDNTTIGGEKTFASATTFSSSTVFNSTATFNSSIKTNSVLSRTSTTGVSVGAGWLGQSSTASVVVFKTKIIEIGDWNMDTTTDIAISHGISDFTKIRTIMALIRPDSDAISPDARQMLAGTALGGGLGGRCIVNGSDPTKIRLERATGGFFDDNKYNMTSWNRGYITIEYEE